MEDTSLCNYCVGNDPLCSDCDPEINEWHDQFPKEKATDHGYWLDNDGFLYHNDEVVAGKHQGLILTQLSKG